LEYIFRLGVNLVAAMDELSDFKNKTGVFSRENVNWEAAKTMDAAKWWDLNGLGAPNLRMVAIRVLAQTTSASSCERNWSKFAQVSIVHY
jgi:hypothetical protein